MTKGTYVPVGTQIVALSPIITVPISVSQQYGDSKQVSWQSCAFGDCFCGCTVVSRRYLHRGTVPIRCSHLLQDHVAGVHHPVSAEGRSAVAQSTRYGCGNGHRYLVEPLSTVGLIGAQKTEHANEALQVYK